MKKCALNWCDQPSYLMLLCKTHYLEAVSKLVTNRPKSCEDYYVREAPFTSPWSGILN